MTSIAASSSDTKSTVDLVYVWLEDAKRWRPSGKFCCRFLISDDRGCTEDDKLAFESIARRIHRTSMIRHQADIKSTLADGIFKNKAVSKAFQLGSVRELTGSTADLFLDGSNPNIWVRAQFLRNCESAGAEMDGRA